MKQLKIYCGKILVCCCNTFCCSPAVLDQQFTKNFILNLKAGLELSGPQDSLSVRWLEHGQVDLVRKLRDTGSRVNSTATEKCLLKTFVIQITVRTSKFVLSGQKARK